MELPLKLELDTLSSLLLRKVVFDRIQKERLREHGAFQSSNLKFKNPKKTILKNLPEWYLSETGIVKKFE